MCALQKIKNLFCLPVIVGLRGSRTDIQYCQDKNEDQQIKIQETIEVDEE